MEHLVMQGCIYRIVNFHDGAFHRAFITWSLYAACLQHRIVVGSPLDAGIVKLRLIAVVLPHPLPHIVALGLAYSTAKIAEGIGYTAKEVLH